MPSIFKIIGSILLGGSAIAAFFFGRKSGLKKADEEISEYKVYAEKEIASAKTETAKEKVLNQKITAEKKLLSETGKIVAKGTEGKTDFSDAVSEATSENELRSVILNIIADSANKAQEAKKRYE